jgi:nucleotide-binding universal stress UspA family protein
MKTQRILAPVDGSEMSHLALSEADTMASQSGGELTLMFVHQPATVHLMDDDFPEPPETTEFLKATAQKIMEKCASKCITPDTKRRIVIERGSPAQSIIDHSGEYDLIVMSTHGHTGLKHVQLGSVTERVVRGAKCDVLVVKRQGDTSD